MNIFKILASGDGRINEPNVSAFLGYLLNPKSDHGFGDEFLRKLLQLHYDNTNKSNSLSFLVDKNKIVRNFDTSSGLYMEILLEQAFKFGKEKKEIVDVVMICYENKSAKGESLAERKLLKNNKEVLKHIFLIENKIKAGSTTEGQLINQYKSTIETLKKIKNFNETTPNLPASLIFISPDEPKCNNEYDKLDEEILLKSHFFWNSNDETKNTICKDLKNILEDEVYGEIEPINEYSKHTIKSFIRFIESNFESSVKEDLNGKWRKIIYSEDEYKNVMINKPKLNLALEVKNKLVSEFNLLPKYTPTYIPFYPLQNKINNRFRVFCGIALNKSNLILSIQKDSNEKWEDFKSKLKNEYPEIKFNENYSYLNSWFNVYIKDFSEFEKIALPLIKKSWDRLINCF